MLRHLGMYINCAINLFVATILIYLFLENIWISLLISVGITACSVAIIFTPLGLWLFRVQNNLREANDIEKKRIDPIFQNVYSKAKVKSPNLPNNIRWYMHDDSSLNAFTTGNRIVGINNGLLLCCNDSEIAAVLAHEFGHIAHRDAVVTAMSIQSNSIVNIIKIIFNVCILTIGWIVGLLCSFISKSQWPLLIAKYMTKFIDWLLNLYLFLILWIGIILSFASCRKQEYDADLYAADLGFAHPLMIFFQELSSQERSFKISMAQMFYGTHPQTEKRIEKLRMYMAPVER